MYRTVDCDTWDDPWFADLEPQAKLLFLYFLTNRRSTAAGCFEITMRAMAFETGMSSAEVERHLGDSLKSRIHWFPEHQVIFVRNFYRHQSGNSNRANFQSSALRVLAEMPAEVQASVAHVYPELQVAEPTHPQPIPNPSPTQGDKEEEEETVEEAVKGEEANARPREAAKPPASKAKTATRVEIPAFEYIAAMCEVTNTDVSGLAPAFKSKQGAAAKQLRDLGASPDDAGRCIGWLLSQTWRTGGVDLFTVVKEFPGWLLLGKPAVAKQQGKAKPGTFSGFEEFDRMMNGQHDPAESQGNVFETTGRAL